MGAFKEFSLPVHGLKIGVHQFKYTLNDGFFQHFEASPVSECDLQVVLELDKRSNMLVLTFELTGWMKAICDRCSADIQMPMENEQVLFVKYSEDAGEEEEDDVIFMGIDAHELNVARYIYEFVVLSLPISNTYDCENEEVPPCNYDILDYLKKQAAENEDDTPPDSSIWDALKDLK
jgi:uncharacterized protein